MWLTRKLKPLILNMSIKLHLSKSQPGPREVNSKMYRYTQRIKKLLVKRNHKPYKLLEEYIATVDLKLYFDLHENCRAYNLSRTFGYVGGL